ncbi:MAG: TVP38/TMEM64 family protein [Gammaproteobacteria bacterium]|nr:TVP38/TMEM64 family protein [Gammaproteobacteria bacterium]MDP2140471.1 TVP38/TMEM64 family protein [Gammaproteobacteria bacterium]MDP2349510.1 TVP38/TMEM64 family protein [Gammaproteobacteria bacterium]
MAQSSKTPNTGRRWAPLLGILSSIVFVSILIGMLVFFDVHEQLVALLEWVEAQGPWAALLFILMMAAVVVLLLPGIFLTTGAGLVFGVFEGTVYVVLGTTLGAGIAFLAARYLLGERARRFIMSHNKLSVVNDEMAAHSFTVVLLTRLIPFFPSKVFNYIFGLTSFSFLRFVLGSLLGFIPFSLHNVYLGSIAGDLASLMRGEIDRSNLEWAMYGVGFLFTIATIVYFNLLAQNALARYADENMSSDKEAAL